MKADNFRQNYRVSAKSGLMTTSFPDRPPWGIRLRGYRQQAGLTQGQFIEKLSVLVSEINPDNRSALERINVLNEATAYFSGVLDAPTLSRLEKGKRSINSRPRCMAFIWGLNQLGVLTDATDANNFLQTAGHGNLTGAESTVLLGLPGSAPDRSPTDTSHSNETVERVGDTNGENKHHNSKDEQGDLIKSAVSKSSINQKTLIAGGTLIAVTALTLAAAAGWAIRDSRNQSESAANVSASDRQSHRLLADDLRTVVGKVGRDQTHTNLHERDQRDNSDDWTRFVKFIPDDVGSYHGYQVFHLPEHIPIESITGLQLEVNFRGPDHDAAPWVWEVEQRDTNEHVRLGDNRDSQWWSTWSDATFAFPMVGEQFDASLYLRDGQIWISLTGKFTTDTLDVDYEVLVVDWIEAASD